jgi:arsenical pump membrane protein
MEIAPLIGILILLITFQINPSNLVAGIIGTATIKPYMIIILFFSLAYACISIDLTGFFAYLALYAAKKSGSSGKKLFFYFFLLSSIMTLFTSNDIVILTLTPIILYFCKYTKANPIPYLIGQFFAANIWSITLYIGNPTNIIVAQAFSLTFLGYSQWMVLPTLIAGISCYFLLKKVFKKDIPNNLQPPEIQPISALKDRPGAIFGITMLITCLVTLSIAPIFNFDMGVICFIFACLMFGKDVLFDLKTYKNLKKEAQNTSTEENGKNIPMKFKLLTPKTAFSRMPWKIMPFVFGMFIMVEVLGEAGWIGLFATGVSSIVNTIGLVPTIFFMCILTSLACNIMNNQPMTIFFTRMLQDVSFIAPTLLIQASMFALIMGSNFGANLTLIGALAGIMWSGISGEKGVQIKYKMFAKYGFTIMPLVIGLASAVLALEFYIFGV